MDVQLTNLQQLCGAIMSIWTEISEECFQNLVEAMPLGIMAVLKAKGGPTQYYQGVPIKVTDDCIFITLSFRIFCTHYKRYSEYVSPN